MDRTAKSSFQPPQPSQKLPQPYPTPQGVLQLPCSFRSSGIPGDRVRASELLFIGRKSFLLSGFSPSCCREPILLPDHYPAHLQLLFQLTTVFPIYGEDYMPSQLSSSLSQQAIRLLPGVTPINIYYLLINLNFYQIPHSMSSGPLGTVKMEA